MFSHGRLKACLIGLMLVACGASICQAQSLTIAWDSSAAANVAGYTVLYGDQSSVYTSQKDAGANASCVIDGLDLAKPHYFAVRAYSPEGLTSVLSEEVSWIPYVPVPPPAHTTITKLSADNAFPLLVNQPVTWTATGASSTGTVEYQFWMLNAAAGWIKVRDYAAANTFTWTPSWDDVGPHALQVWARTAGSTATYEAWVGSGSWNVSAVPLQLTADVDFPSPLGTSVRWTAAAAGAGSTPLEYKFFVFSAAAGAWATARDWSADGQFVWTPQAKGSYAVQAWARRTGSQVAYDTYAGTGQFVIGPSPLKVTRLTADKTFPATTGTTMTWTAKASGGSAGPLEYQFWRFGDATGWTMVQGYSTSNSYTWTPTWGDDGRHALQVWARSHGSTQAYEGYTGTPYFEITRAPLQLTTTSTFPLAPGGTVRWVAETSDPSAPLEYAYWLYDPATGSWTSARGYSANPVFDWTPARAGSYALQVWARRQGSSAAYDLWRGTDYLDVRATPAKAIALSSNATLPGAAGVPMVWTARASGGSMAPLQYEFWVFEQGRGWSMMQGWSSSSSFSWTPATGRYAIQVWVKSLNFSGAYESWVGTDYFDIQ